MPLRLPMAKDLHRLLRHVLDGDAQRKGQRPGHGEIGRYGPGDGYAHRHALRKIVDGDGQGQLGGAGQAAAGTFHLTVGMDVRGDVVYEQQEGKARQKPKHGGDDAAAGHVHGRNEQRPHGRRHHHARSKAQKQLLKRLGHVFSHKEHKGRSQGGPQEGNEQGGENCIHR